ncbi:Eukaryotic aspartyl protease family protein, partial [Prunus dulcis]
MGNETAHEGGYVEGSSALGTFGTDIIRASLSNGRRNRMKDVLIGCTESIIGKGTVKGSDGILGLGFGKYSFTTKAALKYGGKVSYCLLDHMSPKNVTSSLTFGANKKAVLQGKMSYTQLGISVGGKMLNIPLHIWNPKLGGGTLIDSGFSLTFLTKPAYKPVMTALTMPLTKFRRLPSGEDDFDFCFNPRGYRDSLVPKLVFHLAGGAKFAPPVKSYVIDVSPGMKCIGILPAAEGACIIGNIIQQNHLWEFNLVRKTLGFALQPAP